jgi:hypothetical protein
MPYHTEIIYVNLHSSNGKVRDSCPMSRLSHDSDAIGKTDIQVGTLLDFMAPQLFRDPFNR